MIRNMLKSKCLQHMQSATMLWTIRVCTYVVLMQKVTKVPNNGENANKQMNCKSFQWNGNNDQRKTYQRKTKKLNN